MPETEVLIFTEEDGGCPLIEWMDRLPPKGKYETDPLKHTCGG